MDEIKQFLEEIAKRESWYDFMKETDYETTIYDLSGGNYDDSFYGGEEAGEISLARQLLTKFFGSTDG